MAEQEKQVKPVKENTPKKTAKNISITGILRKSFPLTAVSFHNEPVMAYSRIAVYGMLAAVSWKRNRQLGMFLAGAAALSAGTSLMNN